MADKPYSNREIDRMHTELTGHMSDLKNLIRDEGQKSSDERMRIWEEVKKTNGRVRALERWRSYLAGAVAVILTLVIPVLLAILKSYL